MEEQRAALNVDVTLPRHVQWRLIAATWFAYRVLVRFGFWTRDDARFWTSEITHRLVLRWMLIVQARRAQYDFAPKSPILGTLWKDEVKKMWREWNGEDWIEVDPPKHGFGVESTPGVTPTLSASGNGPIVFNPETGKWEPLKTGMPYELLGKAIKECPDLYCGHSLDCSWYEEDPRLCDCGALTDLGVYRINQVDVSPTFKAEAQFVREDCDHRFSLLFGPRLARLVLPEGPFMKEDLHMWVADDGLKKRLVVQLGRSSLQN